MTFETICAIALRILAKLFTFTGGAILGFILGITFTVYFCWAIGAFWKGR